MNKLTVFYGLNAAASVGEKRNPSEVLKELGVKYGGWESQPMADQVKLTDVDLESLPRPLPEFLRVCSIAAHEKQSSKPKTCSSCRYWSKQHGFFGTGLCINVHILWDSVDGDAISKEHQHLKAFVQDCEHHSAQFYTMPDFGCTQWAIQSAVTWFNLYTSPKEELDSP